MKKLFILCLLLLCAGSLFADSLVLYFSRADENYGVGYIEKGNAAIVAEMIASNTGSDLFQIVLYLNQDSLRLFKALSR